MKEKLLNTQKQKARKKYARPRSDSYAIRIIIFFFILFRCFVAAICYRSYVSQSLSLSRVTSNLLWKYHTIEQQQQKQRHTKIKRRWKQIQWKKQQTSIINEFDVMMSNLIENHHGIVNHIFNEMAQHIHTNLPIVYVFIVRTFWIGPRLYFINTCTFCAIKLIRMVMLWSFSFKFFYFFFLINCKL